MNATKFLFQTKLNRHKKAITCSTTVSCDHCDKVFSVGQSLNEHKKETYLLKVSLVKTQNLIPNFYATEFFNNVFVFRDKN